MAAHWSKLLEDAKAEAEVAKAAAVAEARRITCEEELAKWEVERSRLAEQHAQELEGGQLAAKEAVALAVEATRKELMTEHGHDQLVE